jgi:drug/metabolite transporter (DMT)-like permease
MLRARLAVLAAVVMWGVSFVATKRALEELSPVTLVVARFGLGVLVLHLMLAARRLPLLPPRESAAPLALMGFMGVFVHQLVQSNALTMTTAVNTGWLIGITPVWSAVLGAAFLGEPFDARKAGGLAIGAFGALVLITRGRLNGGLLALPSTTGDLLILASTVNWAVYSIVGRRTLQRLGSARATAGSMLLGFLMLAPLVAWDPGIRHIAAASPGVITSVLFLGIGCSALGYLFWYAGLERLDTSQVAAFLYLEPLVTLVAAMAILGETAGATTVLGGVLVIAGVALVQSATPERPASAGKS